MIVAVDDRVGFQRNAQSNQLVGAGVLLMGAGVLFVGAGVLLLGASVLFVSTGMLNFGAVSIWNLSLQ